MSSLVTLIAAERVFLPNHASFVVSQATLVPDSKSDSKSNSTAAREEVLDI